MSKIDSHRRVTTVRASSLGELFPMTHWGDSITVTCGTPDQRRLVFHQILYRATHNKLPVVVLYSSNEIDTFLRSIGALVVSDQSRSYMPLFGMGEQDAASALNLDKNDSAWKNMEWDALTDYLHLLTLGGWEITLSNLRWILSQDEDALLAVDTVPRLAEYRAHLRSMSRYYGGEVPIRSVVQQRVSELARVMSGERLWEEYYWKTHSVSSILRTVRDGGVIAIRLDGDANKKSVSYLCEELSILERNQTPFLLACCDLIIPENCPLAKHLQNNTGMVTFLSTNHLPNAFPSARGDFWKGMIRGSLLVLNCDVGTAGTYSELFGTYLGKKKSYTKTTNRRALDLYPGMRGQAVAVAEDYLPRVEPYELQRPYGGVFSPKGSDWLTIYHDLGLRPNTLSFYGKD